MICYRGGVSLHSRSLTFLLLFPDYANSRCQSYDIDTNSRSGRKRLEKDSIVNFFEKICLRGGTYPMLTVITNKLCQKANLLKNGCFAKYQLSISTRPFCDKNVAIIITHNSTFCNFNEPLSKNSRPIFIMHLLLMCYSATESV